MSDDGQFERFVRGHSASLLRTAFLLTTDQYGAEDLLQDTLTHLYPRWQQVAEADSPLAYVRRSLVNRFLSDRRRAYRHDVLVADVPEWRDPSDVAGTVATEQDLLPLLRGLPDRQRAAVVLRYYHDLIDEQIGALLGCRPATVRTLLRRGLTALRAAQSAAAPTGTEGTR